MCSRPKVDSPRKRKPSAPQHPVGDKRARSIHDPDPPLTVKVEPDEAERMYPGLTAEAQGHCVGVSGMMDVSTAQQVRLLARHVTQALFTSSNDQGTNGQGSSDQGSNGQGSSDQGSNGQGSSDQGSNGQASTCHHAPSVVTDDDTGVTGHDEDNDTGVTGHDEDDDTGDTGHDDTGVTGHDEDDDTGVSGHVEDDDTGVNGHDEDDDMGVTGHDEDDDTGVTRHDEDDDTGVTGEQAAESSEQLRRFHRFRGTVHTLLRFLVIQQTRGSLPHLPADVGPLEEIEDYVQRVLTSLCPLSSTKTACRE